MRVLEDFARRRSPCDSTNFIFFSSPSKSTSVVVVVVLGDGSAGKKTFCNATCNSVPSAYYSAR